MSDTGQIGEKCFGIRYEIDKEKIKQINTAPYELSAKNKAPLKTINFQGEEDL
jgi:hypothetical protein